MRGLMLSVAAALALLVGCSSSSSPSKKSYACPMKCETSDQPGKCSKCGMEMAEVKADAPAKKKYACPMNCVTSDQPGNCPKCGMEMKEVQPGVPRKGG